MVENKNITVLLAVEDPEFGPKIYRAEGSYSIGGVSFEGWDNEEASIDLLADEIAINLTLNGLGKQEIAKFPYDNDSLSTENEKYRPFNDAEMEYLRKKVSESNETKDKERALRNIADYA